MGSPARWVAVACLVAAGAAHADPYDIRVASLGNPAAGSPSYNPGANAAFRTFARQFAAALNSTTLTPPDTLGYSGFAVNAELSVVTLNRSAAFAFPTTRPVNNPVLIPSLHVRKGLPFSLETGARVAWVEKSRMFAGTFELKGAPLEDLPSWPDLGLRGHVTHLFNTRDFNLTTFGLDVSVGKKFPVGGMATLTPYLGWDIVYVGAVSNTVDFDPARTQPESIATPTAQLEDSSTFDPLIPAHNRHDRVYAGARFTSRPLMVGVEVSSTNFGRFLDRTTGERRFVPSVFAVNTTLGLDF